MTRMKLVLAVAAALALPAAAPAVATKTILKGTVGPGFTISLKTAKGLKVTTLKPGIYAITVADKSSIHNFHLRGPGLGPAGKEITGVGFVGTKTKVVTLKKGTYTYVCDPHRLDMRGKFTVK
jgi:plastocyanin